MINDSSSQPQRPMLPGDAFPVAIYSQNERITPDRVRVQSSGHGVSLWVGGTVISVGREASDLQLRAALVAARKVEHEAARFGQILADQLEARRLRRLDDEQAAAMRAAAHAPPAVDGDDGRPGRVDEPGHTLPDGVEPHQAAPGGRP